MITHSFSNFSITVHLNDSELGCAHVQITNKIGPPMSFFIRDPGLESVPTVDLWLDQQVHNITINQINQGPVFSSQPSSPVIPLPFDVLCDLDPAATIRERREAIVKAILHHRAGRTHVIDFEIVHLDESNDVVCEYFISEVGQGIEPNRFSVRFKPLGAEVVLII